MPLSRGARAAADRRRAATRDFRSRLFGRCAQLAALRELRRRPRARPTRSAQSLVEAAAHRAARSLSYVVLRHRRRLFADLPAATHKVTMLLPLTTIRAMWNALDRKVRNQVRKAEKSGLTVVAAAPNCSIDFYAVFARNMRDLGTPVYCRGCSRRCCANFPARRVHVVPADTARRSPARSRYAYRDDDRGAIGIVAARTPAPVPEPSPVLDASSSAAIDEGRKVIRLRPLDAERRHVSLQGAMGRRSGAVVLGVSPHLHGDRSR